MSPYISLRMTHSRNSSPALHQHRTSLTALRAVAKHMAGLAVWREGLDARLGYHCSKIIE